MTNETAFKVGMKLMADVFSREVTNAMCDAYWMALDDMSDRDFEAATKRALKVCRFMPPPAELRDLARTAGASQFCPKCSTRPCECRLLASLPDKPDPRIREAIKADMEALHAHLTPKGDDHEQPKRD